MSVYALYAATQQEPPESHDDCDTESYTHATDRVDSADAPWLHEAMSVNALYAATVKKNLESHDN